MKLKKTKIAQGYSYDPLRDGVSQSILEGWLNCRQLAYLRTIRGLTPHAPSRPLIHGAISHGAIAHTLRKVRASKITAVAEMQTTAKKHVEAAHNEWMIAQGAEADTTSRDIAEEAKALLTQLLPVYWQHWGAKDLARKWTHVEDRFKVPLSIDGFKVPLVGQFDGVFERKKRPCLLETKNKSMWSEQLQDLLPLDLQLGVYLTALALSEKLDPSIVIYNIVRRPNERRGKNETLAGLADRVGKNARANPDHYFVRYEVELTSQEKRRHMQRVKELVGAFVQWCGVVSALPDVPPFGDLQYNSSHCENKYGVCQFLPICSREDYSGFYRRSVVHPELESP